MSASGQYRTFPQACEQFRQLGLREAHVLAGRAAAHQDRPGSVTTRFRWCCQLRPSDGYPEPALPLPAADPPTLLGMPNSFFCSHLLQHRLAHAQVDHQLLELAAFLPRQPQPLELGGAQAAVLLAPHVDRLIPHDPLGPCGANSLLYEGPALQGLVN